MINRTRLKRQLMIDEGAVPKVYMDSRGIPTIGVGRNLRDVGLTYKEMDYLLENDIDKALADAKDYEWFITLNSVRQEVITNMIFNMGKKGFDTFVNLKRALAAGDFETAGVEMKESRWASQVGMRATRLIKAMVTGAWE